MNKKKILAVVCIILLIAATCTLIIINKKPITAENVELVINPRARSAKLRLAARRD